MEGLSRYLKKFSIIVGDKTEEKRVIQNILKTELGFDVSLGQIRIEKGSAILDLSPLQKGELMIRKKHIQEVCVEKGIRIIDLR